MFCILAVATEIWILSVIPPFRILDLACLQIGRREEEPTAVGPSGRASLDHCMTTNRHHDA
jgi:hypothetical protein